MKRALSLLGVLTLAGSFSQPVAAGPPPWDGLVHAPLKTAQPFSWSAHNDFFTGEESGDLAYTYEGASFHGVLELDGFRQAGPYVLAVDSQGGQLGGHGCDAWGPWTELYGDTFAGGTNGCWDGVPYADVLEFSLTGYDSDGDGGDDRYGGSVPFDVPLLNGEYDLKFFVKLDWHLTSPGSNIVMMNDMNGDPRYGKVTQPKTFDYSRDLVVDDGLATEKLVLADDAWCGPSCDAPDADPGYEGTDGRVFYSSVAETFEGQVWLSDTVEMPGTSPSQLFQVKLEGLGSLSADSQSNEGIGYIGRWWDNNTNANISDSEYETVKDEHDVLGYVIFDGFDPETTTVKALALNSSYHTLWTPESGRPAPGNVAMTSGDYRATLALTENTRWWRGVFLSQYPLDFTIE